MSVFTVPEESEVPWRCVCKGCSSVQPQSHVFCSSKPLTSWILFTPIFFTVKHESFQSLGSVRNEIPIERKKLLIIL